MSFATGLRSRALVMILMFTVAVMGLPIQATTAAASSPDIVISQVYGGGGNTGATFKNDFIELFNRGTATIDVSTWSVQDASATGTVWQRTNLTGSIAPGRYYLIQEAAGTGGTVSLPAADSTGTIPMSATAGKVALVKNQTTIGALTCPSGATIADFVGYGTAANCFEDGGPTPTLTNTNAAIRNDNGCLDTDSNVGNFTVGAPNPRNSASPAAICGGVTIAVTVVGPGSVTSAPTGLSCPGVCSATFVLGVTITLTAGPAAAGSEFSGWAGACSGTGSCALTVSSTVKAVFGPSAGTRIHDIQGATHYSVLAGQVVRTSGVVTARRSNGFYIQDPSPDDDVRTSEGIFIFADSATIATVAVNDLVKIVGTVTEFAFSATQLSTTEIRQDLVSKVGTGTIAPTVLGSGGRIPPTTVIENDASGSENTTNTIFDPNEDGLDFYESLEGMLVQINDAVAVSATSARFGELWVVGDNGANAAPRSAHGGVVITPDDFNPERILVSDEIVRAATGSACGSLGASGIPCVNVGATFQAPLVGVMDYDFNTYRVVLVARPTVATNPLTREVSVAQGPDELAIATFNVQNLAPLDPDSKYASLASLIVNNLRSPDVVALEEIQDNNGATDNGVTAADVTFNKLISFIGAAGGPVYAWRSIEPVNDQDGGQPGGNIRVGYIYRADRGLAFVDRPGATSTTPNAVVGAGAGTHLAYSPGRIDPLNAAWSSSRKPLAAEWTYNGYTFFTIANHFNSKGGDESLEGVDQPPQRSSEVQRHRQAPIVNDFVKQIVTANPQADVIVLGDLNDFQFSETMTLLKGTELHALVDTLPIGERYSYVFEGNSQAIDHILLSNHTFQRLPYAYDIVHVNSEFTDQSSDHEPQVVRITFDRTPPVVTAPADLVVEATSPSGAIAEFRCTATDAVSTAANITIEYTIASGSLFPLGTSDVICTATDAAGNSAQARFAVTVRDTTPPQVSGSDITTEATSAAGAAATPACTATDLVSAPTISYAGTLATYPLGTTSVICTARDAAGNSASATVHVTVVDTTKPAIQGTASPAPNGAGWNNTPVTVTFVCGDYFLASCTDPATLTADGAGQSVTGTATDTSGNTSTAIVSGINIDRTAPVVLYSGNAGTYTIDQTVNISCSATDALSGISTTTCASIAGPASGFAVGSNTFTATATDAAGNSTTVHATFVVVVTADSLCALTRQLSSKEGVATSLCQKLANAAAAAGRGDDRAANNVLAAYRHEIDAQSGKAFTPMAAALLKSLTTTF